MGDDPLAIVNRGIEGTGAATIYPQDQTFTRFGAGVSEIFADDIFRHRKAFDQAVQSNNEQYEVELDGLAIDIKRELIGARNEYQNWVKDQWKQGRDVSRDQDFYVEAEKRKQRLNDLIKVAQEKEKVVTELGQKIASKNPMDLNVEETSRRYMGARNATLDQWSNINPSNIIVGRFDVNKLVQDVANSIGSSTSDVKRDGVMGQQDVFSVRTEADQQKTEQAARFAYRDLSNGLSLQGITEDEFVRRVENARSVVVEKELRKRTEQKPKEVKGAYQYKPSGASNGTWSFSYQETKPGKGGRMVSAPGVDPLGDGKKLSNDPVKEIVMSRVDAGENKPIWVKDPSDPNTNNEIQIVPTMLREVGGTWYLVGEMEYQDKRKQKKMKQVVVPYETVKAKLKTHTSSAGQDGFDLDQFLQNRQSASSVNQSFINSNQGILD